MPHYSDGTEAKVGDLVYGKSHAGNDPVVGYVLAVTPASDTCNMHIAAMRPHDSNKAWGLLLSIGCPDAPRKSFAANDELANCKDFHLLWREGSPEAAPANS